MTHHIIYHDTRNNNNNKASNEMITFSINLRARVTEATANRQYFLGCRIRSVCCTAALIINPVCSQWSGRPRGRTSIFGCFILVFWHGNKIHLVGLCPRGSSFPRKRSCFGCLQKDIPNFHSEW